MIIYFWLVAFFLSEILSGMPSQMLNSAWPAMYKVLGVPETNLGILQGTFLFVTTLSLIISAAIKQKIGARNLTGIGVLLLGVGLALCAVSNKFYVCALACGIIGLSCGFVDMVSNYYLTMYYSKSLHTWMNCCWGVGSSLGAFIVSLVLARGLDYKISYRIVLPVYFTLAIIILIVRIFDDRKRIDYSSKRDISFDKKSSHIYSEVFKKNNIFIFFLCLFMANFMLFVYCTWLPIYSVKSHGIDTAIAASFISVMFGAISITRFFSGFIVKFVDSKIIIYICLVFSIIGSVILLFAKDNTYLYYVSCILIGIGISTQYPLLISLSKDIFGEKNLDAVIGVGTSFSQFGGFVGTTLTGFIIGVLGFNSYLPVGIIGSIVAILSFTLLKIRTENIRR